MSPPGNKKNLTGSLKVKSVILRKAMKRIKSIKCHICKKVAFAMAKSLNIHMKPNTHTTGFCVNIVLKIIKQQMDVTNIN